MYVVKMKTLIYYFAIFAVTLAGIGIIKLCSFPASVDADSMVKESPNPQSSAMLFDKSKGSEKDVPIIMYHSILRSSHSDSEYIISEADFERDLKFLKEKGYTAIVMQDLIDFVDGKGTLPEKPIILTFDDGYFNNCSYAFPLLKKYDSKAVISIIGYYTDLYTETPDENPAYSHLTWKDIREMIDSGHIEFQNHSYNLHTIDKGRNGTKKKKGEALADYKAVLTSDLGKLQDAFKNNVGFTPTTFTYPFGSVSNDSFDIIREMGFRASLSCESGMNHISENPDDLYMLKRYLRTPKKSVQTILE